MRLEVKYRQVIKQSKESQQALNNFTWNCKKCFFGKKIGKLNFSNCMHKFHPSIKYIFVGMC